MAKKIIKLTLIILCMITIFVLSSDNGEKSTEKSDLIIVKMSETFLNKKISSKEKEEIIDKYVTLIRKGAHFTIYFLLGLLIISFIKEYTIINWKMVQISVFIVFLYACTDEFHQLFVLGRSGELLDIFIDTTGALVSNYIYLVIYNKIRRKKHG